MQRNNFAALPKDEWITYLQDVRVDIDDKNASYDFYKMLSSTCFKGLLQYDAYSNDEFKVNSQVDKKRCVELLNLYLHFKKQLNLLQSNTNSMSQLLHRNSILQKRLDIVEQKLAQRDEDAADFEMNVLTAKSFCNNYIVNMANNS